MASISVMDDGDLIRSQGVADSVLSGDDDETARHSLTPTH